MPGPCTGGVVTHAAAGAREVLRSRARGAPLCRATTGGATAMSPSSST